MYIESMIGWLMDVEQLVEWELAGETELVGGNLLPCHFAQNKSHMTWPDLTWPDLTWPDWTVTVGRLQGLP
jgi:hypothetical protein